MRSPITAVRHVALAVPHYEEERRFFGDLWGLREVAGGPDHAFFSAAGSPEPFVLRLRRARERGTDLFALAAEDRTGVDLLHANAAAQGARIVSAPTPLSSPGGGYGFRLFDHDGRLIEISADIAVQEVSAPAPRAGVLLGIAHVVFETPDIRATVAWYERVLGLRVSDWLEGAMCFLRGNTTKHHCVAFMSGPPTLNHVAIEMAAGEDVMRSVGRMLKHDVPLTWGPGRHTAGDNVFAYFRTPAGNIFEYTAEIEHLPEGWEPRVLPRSPEIIDQWETGRIAGAHTGTTANWQKDPDPGLWRDDAFAKVPA